MELKQQSQANVSRITHIVIALTTGFITGFSIGIGFVISALLKDLIIDSNSMTVSMIRDLMLPIGTVILIYSHC